MSDTRSRLVRLGGELAVIVFGVLIALWADGLVERGRDRESLTAHLVAVSEEVGELRSSLAETDRKMDALLGFTYSTIKANSGPNGAINVTGLETQVCSAIRLGRRTERVRS